MKNAMRHKTILIACVICLALIGYSLRKVEAAEQPGVSSAGQKSVLLNLTQPIEAQKSSTASARFAELTSEAMKYGMGDATLNGNIEFKILEDRTIRSSIRWDSISIENAGKKVTEGLESSLSSMFRMQQEKPRAEPGTKIKAVGDLEALATALGKLKAKLDEKDVIQKETTNNNKTQAQVSPVVSSGSDANNGKYLSDVGTPFNTVVEAGTSTSYVACDDRFIDIGTMKAIKQFKPVYTKAGVQTGEGVCTPNNSDYLPILSKDGSCSYRFDMANATAIKQTQFFYTDNGTDVLVGGCRDSGTMYPLYESRTSCPVTTDIANMKAFPQSRLVFKVGSVEQNATECRAVSDGTGIALAEEYCDPMFEHDFVNNVSYLKTRIYYISDVDGSKVYVNACGRSSTVSFPHIVDTNGCGWVMDDEKLMGYQYGKTTINTGAISGIVTVRECHQIAAVNYSFLGLETRIKQFENSDPWSIPAGSVNVSALVVGEGQHSNGGSGYWEPEGELTGYGDCGLWYHGKAGQSQIIDLGNISGEVSALYKQGDGTDTVLKVANKTYTSKGGGAGEPQVVYTSGPKGSCFASLAAGVTNAQAKGYSTLGRFGLNSSADYPKAGACGFGAGGMGGLTANTQECPSSQDFIRNGAPGIVIIEYSFSKYMRPDGTSYIPAN